MVPPKVSEKMQLTLFDLGERISSIWQKILFKKRRDHWKKISYERRAYESVDVRSLS